MCVLRIYTCVHVLSANLPLSVPPSPLILWHPILWDYVEWWPEHAVPYNMGFAPQWATFLPSVGSAQALHELGWCLEGPTPEHMLPGVLAPCCNCWGGRQI